MIVERRVREERMIVEGRVREERMRGRRESEGRENDR